MKWERLQPSDPMQVDSSSADSDEVTSTRVHVRRGASGPGKKWGHTCNAIVKEGRTLVYVFGGFGGPGSSGYALTNDLHIFDTAEETWSTPEVTGRPPSARDSHSCTTVGDRLFVFGGHNGKKPLRDVHIFDTSLNIWYSPKPTGQLPRCRESHRAALVGHRLFVFGGCGRITKNRNIEVSFNDLYILDIYSFKWRKAPTLGNVPAPRDDFTCSSYKNQIIVVGGENITTNALYSDVFILDAETLKWTELATIGHKLPPRCGHTALVLGENLFVFGGFSHRQDDAPMDPNQKILFGGLYLLNIPSGRWTHVDAIGESPSPRFCCAADCIDLTNKRILFFGGGGGAHMLPHEDIFILNTETDLDMSSATRAPTTTDPDMSSTTGTPPTSDSDMSSTTRKPTTFFKWL